MLNLRIVCLCLSFVAANTVLGSDRRFVTGSRLSLGTESGLSASVRLGDFDRDGTLDVVVANGRHWPGQNFVFLNQGRARFSIQRMLGQERCTTYATEPADLDGDGDLDIVVGNDMAPNQVFLNDGDGRFELSSTFGVVASVRSLALADMDGDGDVDVLSTCRGMPNQIFLNDGAARFTQRSTFGTESDSTIDVAITDWNGDGHADLILANRDDQRNAIRLNDGKMNFSKSIPFGEPSEQSRAVALADFNGDDRLDIAVANVGQANCLYLADGNGGLASRVCFGAEDGNSYSLAAADIDGDDDIDLVVGNVGQQNAVFLNKGKGSEFSEVRFGDPSNATYGIDTGDLDADGFSDIVTANSGAMNQIFLNRPSVSRQPNRSTAAAPKKNSSTVGTETKTQMEKGTSTDWLSFRGSEAKGVADGFTVRTKWNADPQGKQSGVHWSVPVPGLGHSSPVIVGDRIFLLTAIAAKGNAPLKVGRGGQPDAADDNGEQSWVLLCYDRETGQELWRRTARKGIPRATRHAKATHANTSVAVDGNRLVAFLGSEGMHCYDLDGKLLWSQDLGVINISKYGIGWGFASSPTIFNDQIAIVCDDPDDPFVAMHRLSDGEFVWKTSRKGVCERSWGTPFVHSQNGKTQVVVNGWPWIVSYDFNTGEPIWQIRGGGDNPVPTPFEANGWFYLTNAHGSESPIFVVRPDAEGDITPPEETGTNESIVWSTRRGGSYMSTPVVYGDYLYLGNTNGIVRCFNARSGEKIYEKRLGSGASIIASLIASEGKIFCASENGVVYVVKAGPEFEILAENRMGEPCFASPAISKGTLYFRTTGRLVAIK
ncbi:MAG: FG-GAP-like repeat-containing protein [Planctomycetota bacterium]